MIDTHVHLRDWKQSDKETVVHGLNVAKKAGFSHVFDMPNTNPAIITRDIVLDRIALANDAIKQVKNIRYSVYLGLTNDEEQVKNALNTYYELFPLVIGLKLFAGHSTGNMGIISLKEQKKIFALIKDYDGVLVVHCEKEELIDNTKFNINDIKTHSIARAKKAEVESIKDMIALSKEFNFKGTLHIAHLSTKEGLEIILNERKNGFKISFGITSHHALLTKDDAESVFFKMNPPLRDEEDRQACFDILLSNENCIVESDHAPHTIEDKQKGASGIPGFYGTLLLIKKLREAGLTKEREEDLFYKNAAALFRIEFDEITLVKNIDRKLKQIENEYPFNPFSNI